MGLWRLLFSAMIMIALAPVASQCQTIEVSGSSGQISDGADVYINPNNSSDWPMPELSISFSGLSSCDSVSLSITMSFVDPFTSYTTKYNTSHTMQGGDTWELGWNFSQDMSEGGQVDLFYQIDGGTSQSFTFSILGENTNTSTPVNEFYEAQDAPWFWGNMLALESSGRQFDASNNPLVVGNPDGIGISQVDGVENGAADCYYWNYECNIEAGLAVLNSKESESESNWTSYYAASGDTPPNDPNNPYPYCDFLPNTQPAGDHSFGDADWIQDYNTHSNQHYYLWWVSGQGWKFKYNTTDQGAAYVPAVCRDAAF